MNAQVFKEKTRSILNDNASRRNIGGQRSGPSLDQSRLAMIAAHDFKIFSKPYGYKFKDYAIEIMVDCSGSMVNHSPAKAKPTALAAWKLFQALKDLCKIKVTGFNQEGHDFCLDKVSDEAFQIIVSSTCHGSGGAGNHDGHYIREAIKRLHASGSAGKILLVFSDGLPGCDDAFKSSTCGKPGCLKGAERATKQLRVDAVRASQEAIKAGIIFLAVGILTEAPIRLYGENRAIYVPGVDSIFSQTAKFLEKNIVRG